MLDTIAPVSGGITDADKARRRRNNRIKAILAGGLVLGLGAAVTLAAWTDEEFATGIFTAGHFDMDGSTTGVAGSFSDHLTSPGASLAFSLGYDKLSRNQTVASVYALQLDKDTVYDGTVVLSGVSTSGTATSALSYGIIKVTDAASCTPSATATTPNTVVPAGATMNATTGAVQFTLPKSTTIGTNPGATTFLCIQVSSDGTLNQGNSATSTWHFTATSTN